MHWLCYMKYRWSSKWPKLKARSKEDKLLDIHKWKIFINYHSIPGALIPWTPGLSVHSWYKHLVSAGWLGHRHDILSKCFSRYIFQYLFKKTKTKNYSAQRKEGKWRKKETQLRFRGQESREWWLLIALQAAVQPQPPVSSQSKNRPKSLVSRPLLFWWQIISSFKKI